MPNTTSPFAIRNIRLFIAFRVFFNSRFYYPVFTILFLDFGITIQQFALLNVVWAATIVLAEVPSGALADILGRKKMLVIAGVLMVWEMALLCFAPRGNPDLLFAVFLANRILSGIAEASASGADEAIAYDSLKQFGSSEDWGLVLERQVRYRSFGFIIAMTAGAAVYDPELMRKLFELLHIPFAITQETTLRFPLFLTLIMSVLTLTAALNMEEETEADGRAVSAGSSLKVWYRSLADAFTLTLGAGLWIYRSSAALVLICAGMIFDHVIRMFITLGSQYYRTIGLPEASFGIIGSGLALLGIVLPRIARILILKTTPFVNFMLLSGLTLTGLFGITFIWPVAGLFPVVMLYAAMYLSSFFLSNYLNRLTASSQRATVLSFKGMSYNLAYGMIGILYSMLLAGMRPGVMARHPGLEAAGIEDLLFVQSIKWFPIYFLAIWACFIAFSRIRIRQTESRWWE